MTSHALLSVSNHRHTSVLFFNSSHELTTGKHQSSPLLALCYENLPVLDSLKQGPLYGERYHTVILSNIEKKCDCAGYADNDSPMTLSLRESILHLNQFVMCQQHQL